MLSSDQHENSFITSVLELTQVVPAKAYDRV